jgi:hypothetical protein
MKKLILILCLVSCGSVEKTEYYIDYGTKASLIRDNGEVFNSIQYNQTPLTWITESCENRKISRKKGIKLYE